MGNAFSFLMLTVSVPLGVALFVALRPTMGAIVVYLSFIMFLPEVVTIDAPGFPALGKTELASLACLLGLVLVGRRRLRAARPFRGPEALLLLYLAGGIVTVLSNRDPVTYGPTVLPALQMNEAVSLMFGDLLWYVVPFLVGRAVIASAKELKSLLVALAVAGVVYTPFLFIELMMSPQLHNWVYGFHQHDFAQTLRGSGYRPMVFMQHGLAVALFMTVATLAALALARARRPVVGIPAPLVALYDFGFLAACKSIGALLYAVMGAPLVLFASPRAASRIATVAAILVLTYPASRAAKVFPVEPLVELAHAISPDRAQSLEFRLRMEEMIAEHAADRPMFGWGRFGRNLVYDQETGQAISVSDGHWIILYSARGLVGFVCVFLLLAWPLFRLRRVLRRTELAADRAMLAGLGIMVALCVTDLIPNGLFSPLTVFLAGALHGAGRALSAGEGDRNPPAA